MRAVIVEHLTGPSALQLRDAPEPRGAHPRAGDERVVVDVHVAGVTFPDLLMTRDAYQVKPPVPYVSGGEFAGVVRETSPGSRFAVGDRVAGMSLWGSMAESVLAWPLHTLVLPESLSFAEGAALYVNYMTAWYAIDQAPVREGDTVVVHGAAGGVGTASLDVLRARGVRTIAVVSSDDKARVARESGASEVVRSTGPWSDEVRELTDGRGADVALDPVGGDRFTDTLRALDVGGRVVVIGFAGGSIPTVKVNRLLLRNLTVRGIGLDEPIDRRYPGTVRRVADAVTELAARGAIRPLIGARFPLERASDALRLLERREALGKIVVDVRKGDYGSSPPA